MVIALEQDLEEAVAELANREGISPELAVVKVLRERLLSSEQGIEPRDEWERRLLSVGRDCGVSLPNTAVSSEGLYE